MAFKASASVSFAAAGTVLLPMMNDTSGNSAFGQCVHSHIKLSLGAGVTSCAVAFDARPAITMTSAASSDNDVWALPTGAATMTVTPAGGTAIVVFGRG